MLPVPVSGSVALQRGSGPQRKRYQLLPAVRKAGRGAAEPLYSLRPGLIWRFLTEQPASFWLVCVYLFFEYVRPQQIYTGLDFFPWAQVAIVLALLTFLFEGGSFRLNSPADVVLLLFTAIVLISCVTARWSEVAFAKVGSGYLSWVLIYFLIANIVTTERRFLVFMLSFLLYSFKMSQHGTRSWAMSGFGFESHGVTGAPGWFQNSGEFGIQMAMFIPLVTYFASALRPHLGRKTQFLFLVMVFTAVTGTIGSSSRGAMIAAAGAIFFMVLRTRHKVKAIFVVALLALFVQVMLPEESRTRFEVIGEDETSVSRKNYWTFGMNVIEAHPVIGIGFSNWSAYYKHVHGRGALPHNILIEVTAELGYLGLLGFLGLVACTFYMNWRTRKLIRALEERGRFIAALASGLDAALVGFLIAGQFVTVTYYPFFWINLAMTVALCRVAVHTLKRYAQPSPHTGRERSRRANNALSPQVR